MAPSDGATLSAGTISFEWTSGVDDWTDVNDTIFLLNTTSMEQLVIPILGGIYTDSLQAGIYEWKIRSVDQLGHFSNSSPWSVTLQ